MVAVRAIHKLETGPRLYGPAADFWSYKGHEAILSGPFETGKTFAALMKLHALLVKYPGTRALMTRRTYKSLLTSAVVTYEKLLPFDPGKKDAPVRRIGGTKPSQYRYANGSVLVLAGLDKPGDELSAEYDYIYVNQAEEIDLNAWETLVGRSTGRANNAPYPLIFGDCNPGPPNHWIKTRKSLRIFTQVHKYNPLLYDQVTGKLTAQGKRSMAILNTLTGIRYKRGVLGLWVANEGQVYESFDPDIHVIEPFDIPPSWLRYRSIDFGYTNPFVCQWWAKDHDGRLYLYREIYMSQRTVRAHAEHIKALSGIERFTFTVADHDAEDRATLHENGIRTIPAKKAITRGIQTVEEYLKPAGDGKPRLFIFNDALVDPDPTLYREVPGDLHPVSTEQEFTSYLWPEGQDGKPTRKEVPVDAYNHGMDAMRYMVMALNKRKILRTLDVSDRLT
ncbi:terminase [Phototrophicus methaneseepsis]|uniref:Terminase n=1 Tax=Phototrophicus methaneseepsis TaxID=2710758 RepID=A0A7S8EB76_9CHLR|nr:terminase [Phototrophicus methaneseepsis]QPC83770.1 terminase [Phototrophicus methaneseepsis]